MTKRRKPTSNHQSLLCLAPVEVERFRQVVFCPVRTIADVVQIPGRKLQSIFGLGFFCLCCQFFCNYFVFPVSFTMDCSRWLEDLCQLLSPSPIPIAPAIGVLSCGSDV